MAQFNVDPTYDHDLAERIVEYLQTRDARLFPFTARFDAERQRAFIRDLPEGLAELMVFFCERAAGFAREFGFQEETYMDALVRMFQQALKRVAALPDDQREVMLDRLDRVSVVSGALGYGVADDMDALLADYR